jgi:hypothetical protein
LNNNNENRSQKCISGAVMAVMYKTMNLILLPLSLSQTPGAGPSRRITRGSFFPAETGTESSDELVLSELASVVDATAALPRGDDVVLPGFLRSRSVLSLGGGGTRGVEV